jgi:hypothetical protein
MKAFKKEIRLFLLVWGIFLLGILILASIFLFNRMKNDNAWYGAQIENIGKPIIYEQYYNSPMKTK